MVAAIKTRLTATSFHHATIERLSPDISRRRAGANIDIPPFAVTSPGLVDPSLV